MLKTLGFLLYTEFVLVLRRSQEWLYPLSFFFIVISLFPLAITPDPSMLQKLIPGCIWITALLANLLAVENIFSRDLEDGHLEQLILSVIPLPIFILNKMAVQWIVTSLPLVLLTPLLGLLFHLPMWVMVTLCLSLALGTPILILIGALSVALTLGLRQQGVLLSLLTLPLLIPVLIFGVNIVQQAASGLSIAGPLAFLAGLCVLSITLLPWVIAASLRISLDD